MKMFDVWENDYYVNQTKAFSFDHGKWHIQVSVIDFSWLHGLRKKKLIISLIRSHLYNDYVLVVFYFPLIYLENIILWIMTALIKLKKAKETKNTSSTFFPSGEKEIFAIKWTNDGIACT